MIKDASVVRIHHAQITIPKGEETKARGFYCDFLGLIEVPKPVSLEGRGGFWMDLNGFQIHVGTDGDFDRTKTKAHIAYEVENLKNWREKLESRSIEILDGIKIPGFDRFEFRDPFGNRVEFIEKL